MKPSGSAADLALLRWHITKPGAPQYRAAEEIVNEAVQQAVQELVSLSELESLYVSKHGGYEAWLTVFVPAELSPGAINSVEPRLRCLCFAATDAVAKALAGKRPTRRNLVPGLPTPLQGARRRPRGRTIVVRRFEEVPGETWRALHATVPEWKGTRRWRHISVANRAWEREHGPADPQVYKREILPKLADVPLRWLVAVTGLSTTTCSLIRRGLRIPHPRHWEALRRMTARVTP